MRAALSAANDQPGGEVVAGTTYFGACGATSYAAARFKAAPGATERQQVSFQDEGSAPRFFVQKGGTWRLVEKVNTYPYDMHASCASFTELPERLKSLWRNCPLD